MMKRKKHAEKEKNMLKRKKCAEKAKGLKKHAEKDENVLKRRNVNDTKVNTMTTIETISWSKRNMRKSNNKSNFHEIKLSKGK